MSIFLQLTLNYHQMQGALIISRSTVHTHVIFIVAHRMVDRCRQCRELDNQARTRDDFTLYRAMLKTIRNTEEGYKDDSHVIFLLQVSLQRNIHVHVC